MGDTASVLLLFCVLPRRCCHHHHPPLFALAETNRLEMYVSCHKKEKKENNPSLHGTNDVIVYTGQECVYS